MITALIWAFFIVLLAGAAMTIVSEVFRFVFQMLGDIVQGIENYYNKRVQVKAKE